MRIPPEVTALVIILTIAGVSAFGVNAMSRQPHLALPTLAPTVGTSSALSAFVPGPLTGERTPRALVNRRPVVVVIDNTPEARPQAGIAAASLTFETLTESGITRLMSVYLERDTGTVGPIRSLRPYFLDLASGYRALLVHAGGSPASLQELRNSSDVANIEALNPSPAFHRDPNRLDPHNLFGSTGGARDIARQNGADSPVPFDGLPHAVSLPGTYPSARTVTLSFGTAAIPALPAYVVEYRYDQATDRYSRWVGGAPCTDADTGHQVSTANVAVLQTDIAPIPGDTAGRISIRLTGAGRAQIFEHGREITGRWQRAGSSAPLRFLTSSGSPVAFAPGTSWVEIVGPDSVRVTK